MDRAYSRLDVKAIQPALRRFSGVASTPELDRQGHVVDPAGGRPTWPPLTDDPPVLDWKTRATGEEES